MCRFIDITVSNSQIKAAIRAISNLDNLPVPQVTLAPVTQDDNVIIPEYRDKSFNDILDWLASIFGFQVNIFHEVFSFHILRA